MGRDWQCVRKWRKNSGSGRSPICRNMRQNSGLRRSEREDGLPGLEKVYGAFDWQSSKVYDSGLKYEVLKNDEADVTPVYTTDGPLAQTELYTLLEDDRHAWPPYNLAPVVRDEALEAHPDVEAVLNEVSAALDTETVTQLNAKVDVEKEEYEDVAEAFFEENLSGE